MSLLAGSYEKFIWGFRVTPDSQNRSLTLTQIFSYPSHVAAITAAAAYGPVGASGSSDDTIHLYDLSTASSLGQLHHTSSITALSLYTPETIVFPQNLVSGDADGSVSIYDTNPFVHLKSFRVHKKAINDLSLHPSGRLALTVGRDECLAMVNLVRGRRSFCCRLGKEANLIRFDLDGTRFFLMSDETVGIHQAEDARLISELRSSKRILAAAPGENGLLFTGGENKGITAWDTTSGKIVLNLENAHTSRVKGIVVLSRTGNGSASEDPYLFASASSDGVIRIWDHRMATMNQKPHPLAETNTKSRITCLAGSSLRSLKQAKSGISAALEHGEESDKSDD